MQSRPLPASVATLCTGQRDAVPMKLAAAPCARKRSALVTDLLTVLCLPNHVKHATREDRYANIDTYRHR